MGTEYTLRFAHTGADFVASVLRRIPMKCELSEEGGFEFRAPDNTGNMPDATAIVEANGLYFCDHGGAGRHVLGVIVAGLVSEFGPVTVADRE